MTPKLRRWIYRLTVLVVAPATFVGGLELVLRLLGFGYPTSFFLKLEDEPGDQLVENLSFASSFFPPALVRSPLPTKLARKKAPGTVRIFAFGESATKGEPEPAFGFVRILGVLLEGCFADRRFEVINLGMTAINSHAILPMAREVSSLEGDVWLIYVGNNEVLGPFGAGTVFGAGATNLTLLRASLALKMTRSAQLLDRALLWLFGSRSAPETWRGMEMFLEQQFRRDDPRLQRVRENFDRNLQDIVEVGRGNGAKVILSTIATNLRDCAPFASLRSPDPPEERQKEWEERFRLGTELEAAGKHGDALAAYAKAQEIDGGFAELEFRVARCHLAEGRDEEALRHYILARDLDTIRFRADTKINDTKGVSS